MTVALIHHQIPSTTVVDNDVVPCTPQRVLYRCLSQSKPEIQRLRHSQDSRKCCTSLPIVCVSRNGTQQVFTWSFRLVAAQHDSLPAYGILHVKPDVHLCVVQLRLLFETYASHMPNSSLFIYSVYLLIHEPYSPLHTFQGSPRKGNA